jgi:hypothetical protein
LASKSKATTKNPSATSSDFISPSQKLSAYKLDEVGEGFLCVQIFRFEFLRQWTFYQNPADSFEAAVGVKCL